VETVLYYIYHIRKRGGQDEDKAYADKVESHLVRLLKNVFCSFIAAGMDVPPILSGDIFDSDSL